jgi:NarL family two-component system response regulator LiaR
MLSSSIPHRILIVDDQPAVRESLAFGLKPFKDLLIVGQACDGHEALRLCAEVQPDVIFMDLMMPDMDGAEATRLIALWYPHIRVFVLSNLEQDDPSVQAVLSYGAAAFLNKQTSLSQMVHIIRTVLLAESHLSDHLLD